MKNKKFSTVILIFLLLVIIGRIHLSIVFSQEPNSSKNVDYKEIIKNSKVYDQKFQENIEGLSSNTISVSSNLAPLTPESDMSGKLITIAFVLGGVSFIILGATIIFSFFNNKKIIKILFRDQKRKYDIERIRYSLSAFAKTYGRYPDKVKGEFYELLKQVDPLPIDPLAEKSINDGKGSYGYYYDNHSLDIAEKGLPNTQYYRIWCYLELKDDSDISQIHDTDNNNIYLKTSQDPLDPTLLEEPKIEEIGKEAQKQKLSLKKTIEKQRKESFIRFLLVITSLGLAISAVVNGILYYIVKQN